MNSLRRTGFIISLVALCIIITTIVMFVAGQRVIGLNDQLLVHRDEIGHLNGLVAYLRGAESEQRGYVITGDSKYLEKHRQSTAHVLEELSAVNSMNVSDDLRNSLASISTLTHEKLEELAKTIDLRRDSGFEAAHATIKTDTGKTLMDNITLLVDKILNEKNAELNEAVRVSGIATTIRTGIYIVAALINLYFLRWGYRQLGAEISRREAAITEARNQREEAVRQKNLLSVTLTSIGDCVMVTDLAGHITLMNPVAEELTGWTSREAIGKPLTEVFRIINETTRQTVESPVEKVMRLGQIVGLANHTLLIRKDGVEIPIDDSGAPIRDQDGDVRGVVLVFRDFTAHKVAEKNLEAAKATAEEANRSKDQFLAMLSHELRTPLSPVLTTLSLWENHEKFPAELKPDVDVMRHSIELEARLIDDLLDLTRVEKGVLNLTPEVHDIHVLLDSIAAMYRGDVQARGLSLVTKLDAARHHANVDPARIQQVFWNLLKNAVKFTGSGGTITIATDNSPEDKLRIKFIDTGIGITDETLARLFQPFEQGENKHRFDGLGLGLAISRALADAHQGSISAASEGPGKGACFTVVLPLVEPQAASLQPDGASDGAPRHKLKILLLEDHAYTAQAMTRLLESRGNMVRAVQSISAAREVIQGETFDLWLCDIGLPDGTGVDFLREARKHASTPAIALSGFGMDQDIARCMEAGFNAHLTKPIDISKLEEIIDRLDHKV